VHHLRALTAAAVLVLAAALAVAASASAPPVGPLPAGPTSSIRTQKGELVALALPHRANGRVWRIARPFDSKVLAQIGEADVGNTVVLVFKAKAPGTTTVTFGLTRGETAKAFESRRFVVHVR
jgi:hypothetical protein